MKKTLDIKKLILLNMPYILLGLFATNFGEAWRMAQGADASEKFLSLVAVLPGALQSFWPSLHPLDLLVGLCCGVGLRLAVYLKGKCKCCGKYFSEIVPKHCHHVNNRLPIDRINKVPNLAWLCVPCHRMVHNSPIPPELDAKTVRKIQKYRDKLKMWNLQVRRTREGTSAVKSVESKSI